MCIQIKGDHNFAIRDVKRMPGWPNSAVNSSFYAYGTVSIDGVIYVWLWKSETSTWYRRPIANRLLYSPDLGQTFYRWTGQKETVETFEDTDERSFFFYKEAPKRKIDRDAYAFNWIAFCQNGKDAIPNSGPLIDRDPIDRPGPHCERAACAGAALGFHCSLH